MYELQVDSAHISFLIREADINKYMPFSTCFMLHENCMMYDCTWHIISDWPVALSAFVVKIVFVVFHILLACFLYHSAHKVCVMICATSNKCYKYFEVSCQKQLFIFFHSTESWREASCLAVHSSAHRLFHTDTFWTGTFSCSVLSGSQRLLNSDYFHYRILDLFHHLLTFGCTMAYKWNWAWLPSCQKYVQILLRKKSIKYNDTSICLSILNE